MAARPIDVVLFDLGGVLVDFGGVGPMKELAGIEDDDELWTRWLQCRWVRDFERGLCSDESFAAGVVDDWQLPITPDEFLASFTAWLGDALPGAPELVLEVRRTVPVGCLSNTNALHWSDHRERYPFTAALDYQFVSYEIGHVKPDRELFDHVAERLPAPPDRVLFLDDNVLNVEGAQSAGFVARHARGVDEARAALVEMGVLAGG